MSNLPVGWESRNNQMSEHEIKLGGDAQNKFAAKSSNNNSAYGADGGATSYKNSDEVKAFYMQKIDKEVAAAANSTNNSVPLGWENRQRSREAEAMQLGAFSRKATTMVPPPTAASLPSQGTSTTLAASATAEAALVGIATHTLESMAQVLERNPISLTTEQRTAFAVAMKKAMDAIAKCR